MEKTEKEKIEERWPPQILSVLDGVDEDKLVDAADFDSFVVLILKDGAIFRSSNGFDVRCKAWSFDPAEDTSRETSLYSWLCNLVELKNSSIGKEDEEYPETGTTYGELVESLSFLTVTNMLYPLTAFTDVDKASEYANRRMEWLIEKTKELDAAMSAEVKEESADDLRKNFEDGARASFAEDVRKMLAEEDNG